MVEIFEDRVEITTSGEPLVGPQRFVDLPPRSRNESLPSFMRRIGICEERRSGWVKEVFLSEFYRLPAPFVRVVGGHTAWCSLCRCRYQAWMGRNGRALNRHASLR